MTRGIKIIVERNSPCWLFIVLHESTSLSLIIETTFSQVGSASVTGSRISVTVLPNCPIL